MSQDARRDEEQSTMKRAQILGFAYTDTSQIANKQLFKDILTVPELYDMRTVPITADKSHVTFGVTTRTSQQTMSTIKQRFLDQRVAFNLISDAGFRDYMRLYDPPKQVVYHDIELTTAGTEDLIKNVSATLE